VSLPVRVTPEAEAQIRQIDDWWRAHRAAMAGLFLEELAQCLTTVGHAPRIGRSYPQSPVPGIRRFLLKRTRYHVYYVASAEDVRVLAIWHAQRGAGPPLRA
jgi:plasmid stabilization system protein ParE